jgi:hypothetical protein
MNSPSSFETSTTTWRERSQRTSQPCEFPFKDLQMALVFLGYYDRVSALMESHDALTQSDKTRAISLD